jgi:RHS repeat-associated protein
MRVTAPVKLAGLTQVPLGDRSADPAYPFLFAAGPAGYLINVFDKASTRAGVQLSHPLSGAVLQFDLPGLATERTAAGSSASARVRLTGGALPAGPTGSGTAGASGASTAPDITRSTATATATATATVVAGASGTVAAAGTVPATVGALPADEVVVHWTTFADRLKEELVLAARPAGDQVAFGFHADRLVAAPDGQGGYTLADASAITRFHLQAPTATDAQGRGGAATLTLATAGGQPTTDTARATTLLLRIDPSFLATASYPITVDPTVNWSTYHAYTTLTYDRLAPLSELTHVEGDPTDPNRGISDYQYDLVRNRTRRDQGTANLLPLPKTTYSYDKADRLLSTTLNDTTTTSYTVNAAGNLLSRVGGSINDSFAYDEANRLTGSTVSGSPSSTASYAYNGDGLRTSKTVGTSTTQYVWDPTQAVPVLLADYDGSGTLQRKYVWGLFGLAYNADAAGNVEVYHKDHLNSIRELTDANQQVTTIYVTDEYGVVTTEQTPCTNPPTCDQHAPPSTQPYRFTGELYDKDAGTGFLYLRARVYDPGIGRFITRDESAGSLTVPHTLNRYTYLANNPTNATDPNGHCGDEPESSSDPACGPVGEMGGYAPPEELSVAAPRIASRVTLGPGTSLEELQDFAQTRALELQRALPESSYNTTMAVGIVRDQTGSLLTVIGTNEASGYLRPAVRPLIESGEIVATGSGNHAEVNVLEFAMENGFEVVTIAAGRPICVPCQNQIYGAGIEPGGMTRPGPWDNIPTP